MSIKIKLIHKNYKTEELTIDNAVVKFISHEGKLFQYDGIGHGLVHQYREVSKRVAKNVKSNRTLI